MDACPQGGQQAMDVPCRSARRDWRLASRPRQKNVPCLLCTTGHHRRPAAGARGMLGKTRRQRPVQARQGHRKLMPGTKKTPSRCEQQGGLRTIFGSGLLSHMTLCSIIGDGELNFRVRNGVGCTLSSMATKEISVHLLESDRVAQRLVLGHGPDAHSRRPRLARLVTFQNLH